MKKVYTQNGEFNINECLYESIIKNNPELLIERTIEDDVKNFNKNVDDILDDVNKIFYQNFKKKLSDKQYHRLKDYLETFKEVHNEKELEYRPNHKKIQDMLTDTVLSGNSRAYLIDLLLNRAKGDNSFTGMDLTKVKTNYSIVDDQIAKNDNVSGDIKSKFGSGLKNSFIKSMSDSIKNGTFDDKEEINKEYEKQKQEKLTQLMNQREEQSKALQKSNIFELWDYEEHILRKLPEISKSVVDRCKHVITMSTGVWGGNDAKLIMGGFKFSKLNKTDESLAIKYYLGAMENNDNKYLDGVKKLIFRDKTNDKLKQDFDIFDDGGDIADKLASHIRNDINGICYLLSVNNKNINEFYRAIYLDDVLSNKFNIKTINKQQVFNATEQVMTFNVKLENSTEVACIIVIRPILQRISKLFPDIKNTYDNLGKVKAF